MISATPAHLPLQLSDYVMERRRRHVKRSLALFDRFYCLKTDLMVALIVLKLDSYCSRRCTYVPYASLSRILDLSVTSGDS